MPHRCAFGCKATDVVLHVFQNPDKFPERFKAWVSLVGGPLATSTDYDFYKKKRICDIHFKDEHRNRFKRLNALAVPTLHLPRSTDTLQSGAITDNQPPASRPATIDLESTDTLQSGAITNNQPPASRPATIDLESSGTLQSGAITDNQPPASRPATIDLGKANSTATVLMEHNYSVMSCSKQKASVKGASRTTPRYNCNLGPLQKKIRCLQTEISRLRKRGKSYKERLANAEKIKNDVAFEHVIKHMTKPAQLFVHMQQQAIKKPKGRRFSIKEKILALSLYKRSPKCYRFLYQYFSLPSSKAMKRLLSKIKLTHGINNIIFEKIKKTMLEKNASDRLCSLIFDEMSITPQLNYMVHKDQIEGFSSNRAATFADHVLVFMVKGVKNNFKQPVAYCFTNALNKVELKKCIKEVIQHALAADLIIINTVCDQSPVNVSAITEMVNESKAYYLRQGKEWRHEVMRIMGHNIVPLYDTPHLMKGLRNNLLTKDLIYTTNNEEKIIKWNYYQMVYNSDKAYGELRLLDKLTEEHINPEKINKMRVKSATQL